MHMHIRILTCVMQLILSSFRNTEKLMTTRAHLQIECAVVDRMHVTIKRLCTETLYEAIKYF